MLKATLEFPEKASAEDNLSLNCISWVLQSHTVTFNHFIIVLCTHYLMMLDSSHVGWCRYSGYRKRESWTGAQDEEDREVQQ